MKFRGNSIVSTVVGILAASVATLALFFTVGVWVMFNIFYGCSPYHRAQPDPEPCSTLVIPVTLIAVTAICMLVGWPVYRLAKTATAKLLDR